MQLFKFEAVLWLKLLPPFKIEFNLKPLKQGKIVWSLITDQFPRDQFCLTL